MSDSNHEAQPVALLKYPYVQTRNAISKKQFDSLIDLVQRLHDLGWVHGDIRPANMLFGEEDSAVYLIDFDYSRRADVQASYPSHWCSQVEIKRHPDAVANQTMDVQHDVFALHECATYFFSVPEAEERTMHTLRGRISLCNQQGRCRVNEKGTARSGAGRSKRSCVRQARRTPESRHPEIVLLDSSHFAA